MSVGRGAGRTTSTATGQPWATGQDPPSAFSITEPVSAGELPCSLGGRCSLRISSALRPPDCILRPGPKVPVVHPCSQSMSALRLSHCGPGTFSLS